MAAVGVKGLIFELSFVGSLCNHVI